MGVAVCCRRTVAMKSKMTTTSVTIVTPSMVCVKGPSACSSETTAIADDGDRAMATTAASMAITTLTLSRPRNLVGAGAGAGVSVGAERWRACLESAAAPAKAGKKVSRVSISTKTMANEQPHMENESQPTSRALARSCSSTSSLPAANVMHASAAS